MEAFASQRRAKGRARGYPPLRDHRSCAAPPRRSWHRRLTAEHAIERFSSRISTSSNILIDRSFLFSEGWRFSPRGPFAMLHRNLEER